MEQNQTSQTEKGFTRVSVLLGVVLAAVVVLIVSYPSQRRLAADTPGLEISLPEALQEALSNLIRTKLVRTRVPCANPSEFFQSHHYLRPYTGSLGQARASPPEGLSAKAWNDLFQGPMAANSFAGSALSRCSLSVLGTGGRFHFCLQVERDLKAPQGSFLQTPFIFAEVSIQLQDQKTGRNLTCAQYLQPHRRTAGASVDWLLFAIDEKDGKLEVSRQRKRFSLHR
ncbi:hypothetical protein [Oligoflexus tunisiensis]|uniref:hypothetical protein n=1 Tax=Oligoflexus tunisiensis TaxID=708132 RepID=UPI00114D27E7|nr:hypothetical protein [Oligoflexus tunisiensis]